MKISNQSFCKLVTCATFLLALSSCSGGGSGGENTAELSAAVAVPATLTINSPTQGAANLAPGPVLVTFDIQNSPVPPSTTHPRMHFFIDNDPVAYKFYDGPGITENGSTSGVRYHRHHTHAVHWKSGGSIEINALASGPHQVQFVLVDQADVPIPVTPPVVTDLVTDFRMNKGSGTTLTDASGSGHTGTLVNGPTWVHGQTTYGHALSFDGHDDAVTVAHPGTYNFGTADFTLETWVKRDVLGGGQRHLFSTCTVATWQPGCKEFYFNAHNQLTFGSFSTGDTFSSTIADTAWHHIAVTFTNSTQTMQFYVDGALATTAPKALEADNPGHVMTVGNLLGDNSFSGLLDEFRIFSRVLTQAEIQAELRSRTAKTLAFTILPGTGGDFSLQEVVGGLIFPASMATAPDGRIFVTELYKGNIRVVTPTTTLPWQLQTTPFYTFPTAEFVTGTENGLLGIEVDPNFQANNFVYLFYTAPGPKNRVVRFTATTDSNGNTVAAPGLPTVIVDDLPAPATGFGHDGGVIHFGPDGSLYIFVGENEVAAAAQDLSSLRGKFLRVNPTNGSAPLDNPFVSNPHANAKIYSLGHRNSFGFTFHPHTNDLWETENGENDNDQINRIIAGKNYGWPLCTGICNNPLWIDPIALFNPVIAPTGIVAIREDSAYPPQYHNNLLFADWKFGQLHRIVLGGAELRDLSSPPTIVCDCGQGGLTSVMHGLNLPGQDGYIYVTTGYGGKIFRVLPPP